MPLPPPATLMRTVTAQRPHDYFWNGDNCTMQHLKLGKRNPSPPGFYGHPKTTHPFAIQKQVHSEVHWFIKNDLFISVQNLKYSAVNVVFMNAGWAKAGITCTKQTDSWCDFCREIIISPMFSLQDYLGKLH